MSMKLTLINETGRRIKHRWLLGHLRELLKLLRITRGQWAVTVIAAKEMAQLHARTMNDPTPTDVLTFDMRDTKVSSFKFRVSKRLETRNSKFETQIDLDTILCRDVAVENAKEHGHSFNHELLLYALHSLLHVQGYDDRTPAESVRMHRREDALLIRLGIGPIYKPRSIGKKPMPRSNRKNRP